MENKFVWRPCSASMCGHKKCEHISMPSGLWQTEINNCAVRNNSLITHTGHVFKYNMGMNTTYREFKKKFTILIWNILVFVLHGIHQSIAPGMCAQNKMNFCLFHSCTLPFNQNSLNVQYVNRYHIHCVTLSWQTMG